MIFINVVSVNGFSISSLYGGTSILKMQAGENKEVTLILRSDSDETVVVVSAEVLQGVEIFEIIDEKQEYLILDDKRGTRMKLNVSIPDDAKAGNTYIIAIRFREIEDDSERVSEGRTVSLTTSITKTINVEVVREPIGVIWLILIFLVLGIVLLIGVVVVYFFVRRRKFKTRSFGLYSRY
jgi:hypothetical protein